MPPATGHHLARTKSESVLPSGTDAGRPRFIGFAFTRTPSGHGTAEVILELDGKRTVGRADGPSSSLGDLRMSAEACIRALDDLTTAGSRFDLVGVKHVRAFDANLAIVSITHRRDDASGGREARLVGCYLADADICRGVAIAVLNATNRALGRPGTRIDSVDASSSRDVT